MAGRSAPGPALIAAATAWLDDDPDPADRAEIRDLLDAGDEPALSERFGGPLAFGTAGMRGPMRAGANGMNRATVRRTTAGLAAFLAQTLGGRRAEVVVAFDGRHRSRDFAADCAGVLAGAGYRASLVTEAVPTPLLAFAVRHLRADAGVMITASHNPAGDNGLKVYLGAPAGSAADGAQIIPPADLAIERAIRAMPGVGGLALAEPEPLDASDLVEPYLHAVTRLTGTDEASSDMRIAYTPLHGVGAELHDRSPGPRRIFASRRREPSRPPPTPTSRRCPSPIRRSPALSTASGISSSAAAPTSASPPTPTSIGCAVVCRRPDTDRGRDRLAARRRRAAPAPGAGRHDDRVLPDAPRPGRPSRCRVHHHAHRVQVDLVRADPGLVFAYEEALGYAVAPDVVRDKDGISAAVQVAGLAAQLRREGRTLLDRLDDLAVEFGVHRTGAVSIRFARPQHATDRLQELRSAGLRRIGDHSVVRTTDLSLGSATLPPTDGLVWELSGGGRVVVRPSGTEPTLKAYLELVRPVAGDVRAVRAETATELTALADAVRTVLGAPDQPSN